MIAETIPYWREIKAPIVVARDADGRFLGYAFGAPNIANGFGRVDGQVAVLTHVAVVPDARGGGVGTALVERAVKTFKMLGYSRVFAQIGGDLVSWYERLGWSVGLERRSKTWVEPYIPQDHEWHPDEFEPGEFSPILLMGYLPQYPHLAELTIGPATPLVEATFTVAPDGEESMQRAGEAIGQEIALNPGVASQLPVALVDLLSENRRLPTAVRQLLRDADV
ncbi:GNAT family N-acetyltransferase [Curtobacterium sp. MCPF17_018]|uniref:GNAT family N-acetyltransferase n=1 Tax=Curtobacterium sp. MCPF17_018 TaxID=2175638 RepID=UPI0015E8DCAE|nr:GNAT family N-acetyltransferase [Curtobacterium sp. MCPF17_018]